MAWPAALLRIKRPATLDSMKRGIARKHYEKRSRAP
jgi:hypothetical protein